MTLRKDVPTRHDPPSSQHAVQLTGKNELRLTSDKPVTLPAGNQILARVEATGLCFSDIKLFHQFSRHPRKSSIVQGIAPELLATMPNYVPDNAPTVPGHESVVRIVAVGEEVTDHCVGERCLVQTDYRNLLTATGGNAAFGYNFEGGLQEYVLIDERVSRDAITGERMLLPVGDDRAASAICLVEPWACVEHSYQNHDRTFVKPGGNLLVVVDEGHIPRGIAESFAGGGMPGRVVACCADMVQFDTMSEIFTTLAMCADVCRLPDFHFDDILYFGANPSAIEALNSKLANQGICNVVTGGEPIGRPVEIGVGRIHYGMTRWIGTHSENALAGYAMVAHTCDLDPKDTCLVMGAGGPIGQMHVLRAIFHGGEGTRITATDLDNARLAVLKRIALPLADSRGETLSLANPNLAAPDGPFTYIVTMAPSPDLVREAISYAARRARINVFAGIPAGTVSAIDIDTVIDRQCYLFGTSGSVVRDMEIVINRIEAHGLDTNYSVAAVCGMAGAIRGIEAMEKRTIPGRIIVYPQLHALDLTPLAALAEQFPSVAERLHDGVWTREAEQELLKVAG